MNLEPQSMRHQRIMTEIENQYDALSDAILISPAALAKRVYDVFSSDKIDTHIEYASLEHLKQMSREYLRKTKDADAEASEAYTQEKFDFQFSGQLQDRYPIPRKRGEEPVYKLRAHLSAVERAWNVEQLRKSATARLEHARALEAEGQAMAANAS